MPIYIFASVRGDDFEIEGDNPEDAFKNLPSDGSLWRLNNEHRNRYAVEKKGFTKLGRTYFEPVYKKKEGK